MYAFEPQFILTAVGISVGVFFTVIGAMWVVWKTFSELRAETHKSQVETNKSLAEMIKFISESQAKTDKSIGELRADTAKSIGESQAKTDKSLAETNKAIGELKADTAKSFGESQARTEKSFGEVRVDIKGLDTRMDCLDKHMDTRMGDLGGEVRGINEFLRRESVKDIESDKES